MQSNGCVRCRFAELQSKNDCNYSSIDVFCGKLIFDPQCIACSRKYNVDFQLRVLNSELNRKFLPFVISLFPSFLSLLLSFFLACTKACFHFFPCLVVVIRIISYLPICQGGHTQKDTLTPIWSFQLYQTKTDERTKACAVNPFMCSQREAAERGNGSCIKTRTMRSWQIWNLDAQA